jgi:hypothetical protein
MTRDPTPNVATEPAFLQFGRRDPEEQASKKARVLNKEKPINPVFYTIIFAALATIIEQRFGASAPADETLVKGQTMLIHPLVERLRGLGLTAMADAFLEMCNQSAADDLSRED